MIALHEVSKVFNQGQPNECRALCEVSLRLERGGITVFKGPSGSGKTTLLTLIGCLAAHRWADHARRPAAVQLAGAVSDQVRRHLRLRVPAIQSDSGLTVLDNVMLPPIRWVNRIANCGTGAALFDRFGLGVKADSRVEWLSGGEAQRTALARA